MSSITKPHRRGGKWPVLVAWLGIFGLLVAALLIVGAGLLYRLEWMPLGTAFTLLRQGAYLAIGAGALGLVTLVVAGLCRRWRPALVGALVSLAVLAMIILPVQMMQRARNVPPTHDITTDPVNPPAFKALASAREAAPNAVDYPGQDTARQQRAAYPKLKPITLNMTLASARTAVETTAREQGWEIVAITETGIEATATTRWFGFKDDVVIRLSKTDQGVQVDMRSASRIGKSDLGTNAARIEAFLAALQRRVE